MWIWISNDFGFIQLKVIGSMFQNYIYHDQIAIDEQ